METKKLADKIHFQRRPWGHFERSTLNERCSVKLLYVEGGKRLSLQYHENRTEFWKVIDGPVKVQLGNKFKILETGDSMTIMAKAVHRLIGLETKIVAVILEISTGHFDENDIVRLQDDYDREVRPAALLE